MYSLTTPQHNIWNLQKTFGNTSISNLCGAVFFGRKIDADFSRKALNRFIELQAGMRMQFDEINGEVCQYTEEYTDKNYTFIQFKSKEEFETYAKSFALTPFEMKNSSMYRFVIFELNGESGILSCLSHLISDAWTFSLLAKGVYNLILEFEKGTLSENQMYDYAEFVNSEKEYLDSERFRKDEAYWNEVYSDKPESSPVKMKNTSAAVPKARRFTKLLSPEQTAKINTYCNESRISQAVLFETAVLVYLSKINPENKYITIGVPVLNRKNKREKSTVGMFISTIPLTIDISAGDTAYELSRRITDTHSRLFRHQKYPYSRIVSQVRQKHQFEGSMYDVVVSFQNAKTDEDIKTRWFSNGYSEIPFSLHIDNRDSAESYTLNADYQTEVFPDSEEISMLTDRLMLIIDQIIENHNITVCDIDIIPEEEYQKVVLAFNDTSSESKRDKCIHELFSEQAMKTPGKTALVFEDKRLTYKQLDEMSDSLAHYLREEKGIRKNDIVPIISKRSRHFVTAMLGVMKAGGAYMPVDPSYPSDRIEYMLKEAGAKVALVCGYTGNLPVEAICLEAFDYNSFCKAVTNINYPDDKCYVLFTSGSTGKPKAVMISHNNLSNFVDKNNQSNVYQRDMVNLCNTVLALTTFSFDISVFEIFLSLINGLRVVLSDEEENLSAELLAKLIIENDIDVVHSTPTKFLTFLNNENFQKAVRKLKVLMIGAEVFTGEIYNTISKYTNAIIYNGYGPTETTIGASFKKITDKTDITIGRPIANTQIYILDKYKKPLPVGIAGELCISGDGVGKGYLNIPELTAESFIKNPFYDEKTNPTAGKIMYCTGDLARWRADGEIEYLGRIDSQVKIRGLRIEPEEIESVMSTFDGINMTAVTDKRDENNRQYLVGYYTAKTKIDEKLLRQHLSAKLPKYMIPNYFVHLSEVPLTSSGKTDRKNLPVPDFTVSKEEYAAPETETEIRLSKLWSTLMKLEKVGRYDDFYELGGDSLMAITLLGYIENEFNVNVSMKDILENSVLENLAECIEKSGKKPGKITSAGVNKYSLLPQQKAIYAVCSKKNHTLTYNMPARIFIPPDTDRDKIKACFEKIIKKYSSLRTYISAEAGNIFGIINENAELVFEEYTDENYMDFVRPFDLSQAPLMRIGFTETSMLFDLHHIVADGESLNIILSDLAKLYIGTETASEKIRYADYAEYFKSIDFSGHKAFYRSMLKYDPEPIVLPEKKNKTDSEGVSKIYSISKAVFENAKRYAHKNGLTDTMLFLGAFGILLSKYTAKPEVLTSVMLTNRTHKETQDIVGMFVNTLPVFMNASGKTSEFFEVLRDTLLNMFEYQELPFTEIAEDTGMTDKSVINTSFVYQADGEKKLYMGETELVPEFIDTHTSKFDITFEMTPIENGCAVRIEYNSGKYEEILINKLFEAYTLILEQLETENISDIFILDDEEYKKVIFDFNDTDVDHPDEKCIHELFKEQAAKTPDKTALVFEDRQFTYKHLDKMSDSLANYLRNEKNIMPNDIVPVIAKRSWHIIVAMLGILKAGGAYMPVDPSYPQERILFMLEEADAKTALTFGYEEKIITDTTALETFDYSKNTYSLENCNTPDDLCYLITTSGSTGKPKATMQTHFAVRNYADKNSKNIVFKNILDKGQESIVSVTNFVFDIFVTESIVPVLHGLTVYFTNDDEAASQNKLALLIENNQIDIMQTTPTKMRGYMLDKNNLDYLKKLKTIILGGEALPADLYEELSGCTEAEIYNIYGPAETTVWSTNSYVNNIDITIGRPIANTQVYILDQHKNPLPVGVAGELCISGAGVGKGYLNRPELTAKKFIQNPFYDEKLNPSSGKIMYCTGDLARWRADGHIEYLGRIDTQVKIRGLRIELGEIESIMSAFDGINMTAVTDKRDEKNRQYLVGYYTAKTEIDEKSLRQYLSAKLPKYMVPGYFVHLDKIPVTASGKTDRRNLPLPDFTVSHQEYIAPAAETEIKLCNILAQLFEVEKTGVTDDFFDIGGDSLRAIEYVSAAHNEGIYFSLQNVFDYPTVRELCEFIQNSKREKISFADYDFSKISSVLEKNRTELITEPEKTEVGNLLLAGATGYLGIHILSDFLENDTGTAYCLVRGNNTDDSKKRLDELLEFYFDDKYLDNRRIEVICADLQKEKFGLSDDEYEKLGRSVSTVVNSAASVKHYGLYTYFYDTNVKTTKQLIEFCKKSDARLIHISTLSVSGNSFADEFDGYVSETVKHFSESSLYIGQPLENVYSRSKFIAELEVLEAVADGLQANIMRMGNLTNRFSDGLFQKNHESNAFLKRVRSVLELGMIPDYLMDLYAEFTPVDEAAQAVMTIARSFDSRKTVFHINSVKVVYMFKLYDHLTKLGIKLRIVSGETFGKALRSAAVQSDMEHIFETFINDMDENEKLSYDSNIRIENDFTVEYLKKLGFEWSDIDFSYLKKYIEYFRKTGYLDV